MTTKSDIIARVADSTNLHKTQVERVLNASLIQIADSLKCGESVALAGFGTFDVKTRAARDGRNPQTGATIKIAASKSVGFKPAKALKDGVN